MKALMAVWFFILVVGQMCVKGQEPVLVLIPSIPTKGVEASLVAAHYPRNLVPFVLHSDCKRPLLPTEVRKYREATYCVPVSALDTNTKQERNEWYARFVAAEKAFVTDPLNASYIVPSVIFPENVQQSYQGWAVYVSTTAVQQSSIVSNSKPQVSKAKATAKLTQPLPDPVSDPLSRAILTTLLSSGKTLYVIAVPDQRRSSFEQHMAHFGAESFYKLERPDSRESAP